MDARTAAQGAEVVPVVVCAFIYIIGKTKYNLFISVKNSIKHEFILFFVWWYQILFLPLQQI